MRLKLQVLAGVLRGQWLFVDEPGGTLGRAGEVRIPDPTVASRHVEITVERDFFWLRDLGSTHGTFLNGQRVGTLRVLLPPSGKLKLGDVILHFSIEQQPTAPMRKDTRGPESSSDQVTLILPIGRKPADSSTPATLVGKPAVPVTLVGKPAGETAWPPVPVTVGGKPAPAGAPVAVPITFTGTPEVTGVPIPVPVTLVGTPAVTGAPPAVPVTLVGRQGAGGIAQAVPSTLVGSPAVDAAKPTLAREHPAPVSPPATAPAGPSARERELEQEVAALRAQLTSLLQICDLQHVERSRAMVTEAVSRQAPVRTEDAPVPLLLGLLDELRASLSVLLERLDMNGRSSPDFEPIYKSLRETAFQIENIDSLLRAYR